MARTFPKGKYSVEWNEYVPTIRVSSVRIPDEAAEDTERFENFSEETLDNLYTFDADLFYWTGDTLTLTNLDTNEKFEITLNIEKGTVSAVTDNETTELTKKEEADLVENNITCIAPYSHAYFSAEFEAKEDFGLSAISFSFYKVNVIDDVPEKEGGLYQFFFFDKKFELNNSMGEKYINYYMNGKYISGVRALRDVFYKREKAKGNAVHIAEEIDLKNKVWVSKDYITEREFNLVMNGKDEGSQTPYECTILDALHFCNRLNELNGFGPCYEFSYTDFDYDTNYYGGYETAYFNKTDGYHICENVDSMVAVPDSQEIYSQSEISNFSYGIYDLSDEREGSYCSDDPLSEQEYEMGGTYPDEEPIDSVYCYFRTERKLNEEELKKIEELSSNEFIIYRDFLIGINETDDNDTDLAIPAGVKDIASCVFMDSNFESAVIPEGVTQIGRGAFCGSCLTSVVIPESVRKIGAGAFYNTELEPENITAPDWINKEALIDGEPQIKME